MTKVRKKLKLTDKRDSFKPFSYPEFYDLWLKHEQIHWIHSVIPMYQDIYDWNNKLNEDQKKFLTHIFRLFTQGDIDVAKGYVENYLPIFPQPEVRMMLLGFAAREAVHIAAYSHLIETLGFPETIYNEFLEYKEMIDKHKFFEEISGRDHKNIIQQMCAISSFTEGLQLFSSFVMLLNFGRNGLMPGMTKIVTWSIIDESIHVEGMTKMFRQFVKENKNIWDDNLKSQLYSIAEKMVELEDKFIDLAYGVMRGDEGFHKPLYKDQVHEYIRYIADRRLISLGLKGIFKRKENPLPWVDEMLVLPSHSNFFEVEESSYSKGALQGSWDDVWGSLKEE